MAAEPMRPAAELAPPGAPWQAATGLRARRRVVPWITMAAALVSLLTLLPLAFIAAFITQKLVVEREEKVLAMKFGKKYRDYSKTVRRWI